MDNTIDHTLESANRVYGTDGLSPALNCCGGGGLQPKIIDDCVAINIPQTVSIRVYDVDILKLQNILRTQKKVLKLSNQQIANNLEIPISQVEHYFRTDKYFAIPDADVWPGLSKLLQIDDAELDRQIMTFEEKEGVFEKSERHYLDKGVVPTVMTDNNDKIIVAMRGRNPDNPTDRTAGIPTEQRLEPNSKGLCNSLTSATKDNMVLIKQATKQGYIECELGGGGRLKLP